MGKAVIRISPEMVLYSVAREQARKVDGIPGDAKALRCGISDVGDVYLMIESAQFEEREEGAKVPEIIVTYTVQE